MNRCNRYLSEKEKVYAFGTKSFKEQLKSEGIVITNVLAEDIDCLCLSNDTELEFKKLEDACILLGRGVDFIATNPDWVCPSWCGYVPDCGAMCQMLCHATGRKPMFIGKPEPTMAILAIEKTGFKKEETSLVGDRLYTDIACGVNAGISSIFVLSGEGTMEDVEKSDVKPDFIYNNIKSVYDELKS